MIIKKNKARNRKSCDEATVFEVSRCGKDARLMLTALGEFIKEPYKLPNVEGALTMKLIHVLQTDPVNKPGSRRLELCNLRRLEGFDLYGGEPTAAHLAVVPEIHINRRSGKCVVNLPRFMPLDILPPKCDATHITIVAATVAADFAGKAFTVYTGSSIALPVGEETGVSFGFDAPKGSAFPIIVLTGVQLNRLVQGKYVPAGHWSLRVEHVDMAHSDRWKDAPSPRRKQAGRRRKLIE